jgi:hypothetical protein
MLPILGILTLASYLLDTAALRPPGSIIHHFSTLSCISFVAEFFRSGALAFWECRKSSIEVLSLRSSPVNREEARGYATVPVESVVGPLVVQQFRRRSELDRPFTNRIRRNCLALGVARY